MDVDYTKIDARREMIGTQMVNIANKLVEWASPSGKKESARFAMYISLLQQKNLKLLCTIAGKSFTPVESRIIANDSTIWFDKEYTLFVANQIFGNTDETFSFSSVFAAENENVWSTDIHKEFWKRINMILKIYKSLSEIDSDMPLYSMN